AIMRMMDRVQRQRNAPFPQAAAAPDYLRGLRVLVRSGRLLVLAMVSGIRAMTQLGLSTFLPLYLSNELHLPSALLGLYLAIVQASGMVATPIAGALSDRLGPKRVATTGMFTTSVVVLGFAALNLGTAFVAALALLGFFVYSMRPAIFRWAIGVVPREYEGAAVGILFTTQGLLPTAMPLIGGYLADRYGLLSIFYVIAGTVLDRKSTRLNSSHVKSSYAVFCLKKKKPAKSQTKRKKNHATRIRRARSPTGVYC